MIAAAKKLGDRISSIVLWPLNVLAASVARANRRIIRWAIRRRSGAAYLFAIFWFPAIIVAGLVWAAISVHEKKPSDLWPTLAVAGVVFLVAKKVLAIFYYLIVVQGDRITKALRHYRRHFG
jgi:hypothetical protein